MSIAVLDIQHVTHRYGERVALDDVSLHADAGAFVGLLGPNGSGKTTLFRIVTTLLAPDQGTVIVCGADVADDPAEARRAIGVVFQDPALDADLTVRENLRHYAALHGLSGQAARTAADEMLRVLHLSDRANDRVRTLSGGLTRRADLARVLMHRPRLLLLDEPTAGLDPSARRDFWDALAWLRHEHGTTVIVATHMLEEADQCDHICIMSEGRIVAEGSPSDLKTALGRETLWIETPNPDELADRIQAQFGVEPHVLDGSVHLAHAQAHHLLARIYEALPERIVSATVRRPTLEDAYLVHTGHGLTRDASPADQPSSPTPAY